MNVLALYDIHGNIDALEAVLADPRAANPDVILVGGDAVPGPFARATLARLDELNASVRWVRGNGEREVAEAPDVASPPADDLVARVAAITAAEIGDERARSFAQLPLTVELDGVLYCHASPRRDDELLTRLSPGGRWEEALGRVECALLVAGHTHQQDDRVVGDIRFVNAGSVGLPYEGDGAARWLWVADGAPELRQTSYDAAGAGARMLEAGWADERSVRAALIEPVDPMTITRIFEEVAAGQQQDARATSGSGELMLDIKRLLPARRSVVFDAFSVAEDLARWWGPKGFSVPSLQFAPRVGESFRIEMQPPHGEAFHLTGRFRAVDPPARLAFTFTWLPPDPDDVETLVELSFRELDDSTEVGLTQGPFKTEARRELHRNGWGESFDKLDALVAQ